MMSLAVTAPPGLLMCSTTALTCGSFAAASRRSRNSATGFSPLPSSPLLRMFRIIPSTLMIAILSLHSQRLAQVTVVSSTGQLTWVAGLCLLALGGSAWFWYWLMRTFGEQPEGPATVRAYYIGHLGKYVPGKAWALLMRGNLVRGPGVRLGVAIITAFYEVLTTMA